VKRGLPVHQIRKLVDEMLDHDLNSLSYVERSFGFGGV
jgi:hypothetical protein